MVDLAVPRKRRRPAKSCEPCRRRKIRCDQNKPCMACVRARASLQCSYRPDSLATPPPVGTDTAIPHHVSSEAPSGSVLSPNSPSPSVPTVVTVPQRQYSADPPMQYDQRGDNIAFQQDTTIQELRRRVQHLEAQLASSKQLSQLLTPSDTTYTQRTQPPGASNAPLKPSQFSDACIPVTIPRLRNAPDKTKLFGQSHWLHTADKFQVVGKFDAVEIEPSFSAAQAELTKVLKETRSLRCTLKAQGSVQLTNPVPDLRATLPRKAVCDELVRLYLRTFEVVYRIIHVPTFWKEYTHFWEQQDSTSIPSHFLMKLVLILAIGTTFFPDSADVDRTNLLGLAQKWIYAAQWWLSGPSEKSTATLDGLQTFCLLLIARQSTHDCPGGPTWLSVGSLMTMAQSMGLHRNPSIFSSLTPFQVEMRVRLWTTVLELVCKSCLDSALPPCISVNDFDTNAPSNFNDQDLDPAETTERLPREDVTDSSLQILLAKSLPLRLKITKLLNDFRSEQSYQTALTLGAELRSACRDVASFFHVSLPRSSQTGSTLVPTDFHRKFLDIYLRKCILLLHRPFMLQARKDARFYLARKVCVESATVIGSYYGNIKLQPGMGQLDELSRLSMVGRGVFKGALSLDIIMVLALEVITQLEDEGPNQSVPDPLDEINKANRASLVRILENISSQLLQPIRMGSPSLKSYLMLSAYLSQIQAMESGQCVKQVVYTTLVESLKQCHALLQAQARPVEPSGQEALMMSNAETTTTPFYPLNMESMDADTPWDISCLLDFPLLNEEGRNNWFMG